MAKEKLTLVRRQNGPDLVFYDDAWEPRVIKIGEWISAVDPVAKLPELGRPEPLPGDAEPAGPVFVKGGVRVQIFRSQKSREAQQAADDSPGIDRPERHGELAKIRGGKEDFTATTAILIPEGGPRSADAEGSCVRAKAIRIGEDGIPAALKDLSPDIYWVLVLNGPEPPQQGQLLAAVEKLDRSSAALIQISCGVVCSAQTLKSLPTDATTKASDLPKIAAAKGAATINGKEIVIKLPGITVPKGRPKKSAVGVVVTVHNALRATSYCLESLKRFDFGGGLNPRVIVVDDESAPHVEKKLRAICGENKWIYKRNITRQGYTRTVTSGLDHAVKLGCKWICILNSDTLVTPGWLYKLVRAGETDPKIGMVGPYSNAAVHLSLPQWLLKGEDPVSIAGKLALTSKRCYPDALTPTGFCLLLSSEAWKKHRPFRDDIYGEAYGEETEFWAQLVKGGGRAILADDAFVWHQGHASYGQEQGHVAEGFAVAKFKARHGALLQQKAHDFNATAHERILYQANRFPQGTMSRRPRIAFFAHEYGLYGGVLAIANIVNRLIVLGWDARIAVRVIRNKAIDALPLLTHPVPFGSKANFMNHFASEMFDSGILCATVWDTAFPVAEVAKINKGIKPCYFIQDDETTFTDPDGERFVSAGPVIESYSHIRKKIVNSKWVVDRIAGEHKVDGCVYIPVGVDTNLFHPRHREDSTPTVLFFCRPETPRRGADLVQRVCSELTARYPDLRLVTYGGTLPNMPAAVEQLGTIPQEEAAQIYSQADVFLEASHTQGFGLQGLEAMASRCAVVSTRNRGIDNYGRDQQNCTLIDIGDQEAAVGAIVELIEDHSKRQRYVDAGMETAAEFDWWRIAEQWDKELRKLL